MDALLKHFFEHFESTHRNSLHAKYKRSAMVDYMSTLIEGCRMGEREASAQKTVREAVIGILRYHETSRDRNAGVCLMGKYHNVLYVAAKVSYDWQLEDSATVAALLEAIFLCERTFERLLMGALFGPRAPHFLAGWKSDFATEEENVAAMVFFMQHAEDAQSSFAGGRFIDVPIESCGGMTSLKICAQLGSPDKLLILLRFGAMANTDDIWEESVLYILLKKLSEFEHSYPFNLVSCLQILLRAIPSVQIDVAKDTLIREAVLEMFPNLVQDCILPMNRCGFQPPELKHLCRCVVRQRMWLNFQIPSGIKHLPIPESLHRYVDIMVD